MELRHKMDRKNNPKEQSESFPHLHRDSSAEESAPQVCLEAADWADNRVD